VLLTPEGGLAGVLLSAFLAATLLPLSSEAVLFAYLRLHPEQSVAAIALATLGNTAGGMTSYAIGRFLPAKVQRKLEPRALGWLRKMAAILAFSDGHAAGSRWRWNCGSEICSFSSSSA